MSNKNIEIEFKNLITRDEFIALMNFLKLKSEDFIKQENHYFDTPDFLLKEKGSALRIRQKNGSFELTLKQPHPDGLLETNEDLTESQAAKMIRTGKIPVELIKQSIEELGIKTDNVQYFGTLTTKRAEKEYKNGLAVLDHSLYLEKEDFELEFEVDNRDEGESIFVNLLQQLNIPVRNTENKIKRFYTEKYRQQKAL